MPEVGHLRRFSFLKELCEIVEIIENPNVSLVWNWGGMVCPHCSKTIDNFKTHVFNKIELLIPQSKSSLEDFKKRPYLIALGFDAEGRTMLIPKEKHPEIFSKSQKFKGIKINVNDIPHRT